MVGKASLPYSSSPTVGVSIFLVYFVMMSYIYMHYKMVICDVCVNLEYLRLYSREANINYNLPNIFYFMG